MPYVIKKETVLEQRNRKKGEFRVQVKILTPGITKGRKGRIKAKSRSAGKRIKVPIRRNNVWRNWKGRTDFHGLGAAQPTRGELRGVKKRMATGNNWLANIKREQKGVADRGGMLFGGDTKGEHWGSEDDFSQHSNKGGFSQKPRGTHN